MVAFWRIRLLVRNHESRDGSNFSDQMPIRDEHALWLKLKLAANKRTKKREIS